MTHGDPKDEIAALNRRGRKKAMRRALKAVLSLTPAVAVFMVLILRVGEVGSTVAAGLVGLVTTLAVEKLLPGGDPTLEE